MAATRSRRCSVAYQSSSSHFVTRSPVAVRRTAPEPGRDRDRRQHRTTARAARPRADASACRRRQRELRGARTGSRHSDTAARASARRRRPPSAAGWSPSGSTRSATRNRATARCGERGQVLIHRMVAMHESPQRDGVALPQQRVSESLRPTQPSMAATRSGPSSRRRRSGSAVATSGTPAPARSTSRRAVVAASSDVDEQSTAWCSRAAATSRRRLRSVVALDQRSRCVVAAHPRAEKPVGAR